MGALVLARAFDLVHGREPRLGAYLVNRVRFLHTPPSVSALLPDALEHIVERLHRACRDTSPLSVQGHRVRARKTSINTCLLERLLEREEHNT